MSYELLRKAEGHLAQAENALDDALEQAENDPGQLLRDAVYKTMTAQQAVQAIFKAAEDAEKAKDWSYSRECP